MHGDLILLLHVPELVVAESQADALVAYWREHLDKSFGQGIAHTTYVAQFKHPVIKYRWIEAWVGGRDEFSVVSYTHPKGMVVFFYLIEIALKTV